MCAQLAPSRKGVDQIVFSSYTFINQNNIKMTKLYRFFKTQLLLVVVLLVALASFAQEPTVSVPSGCIVVQTGLGGVLGTSTSVPPGRVGNGGIVTMTDPYAGGTFTFNPNNTTSPLVTNTVGTWLLSGDLSSTTLATNVAGAPSQIIGTPLTATIKSYNKLLRTPSENTPPSISSWGRSKGRVTIQYTKTTSTTGSGCGNGISFDVFKVFAPTVLLNPTNILVQPTNVPKIIGPRCVKPGLTYTFSVDQIVSDNLTDGIGLDNYYWSFSTPASVATSYTSADKSSITLTMAASATFLPFTLKCCYGRSNPWDGQLNLTSPTFHTTCVSLGIVQELQQPTVSIPCIKTGDTSFSATVDPAYVTANTGSGTTYTWATVGSNWTLTNPNSPNLTGTLPATDNNPCTLTLTVNNNICTPASVYTYTVWRDFVAPFAIDSYPTPGFATCLTPNATLPTTLQYSIPASGLDNITAWSITPTNANGLTIASGANATNSIVNLSLPNATTAVAGAYVLKAIAKNCSNPISVILNVKPKAPIGLAGLTCVQRTGGASVTYSCTAVPGVTGYIWSFPAGWATGTISTTTNSVSIVPNGTTSGGVVKVKAYITSPGTCDGPNSADYNVNYNPVTPTGIASSSCISSGAINGTITISNPQNFGYYTVTSVPAGITAVAVLTLGVNTTSGTNMILNIPSTLATGNYTLFVTHNTASCSTATNATGFPITLGANVAGATTISLLPSNPCDLYSYNNLPAGTIANPVTASWVVNGNPPTGNQYSIFGNGITLCGTSAPSSVCLDVTVGGCISRVCFTGIGGTHGLRQVASNTIKSDTVFDTVKVYPNPNSGNFVIKVADFKTDATATLADISGKTIETFTLYKGVNKILKEGLAQGTFLVILTIDGKTESRQIIIK